MSTEELNGIKDSLYAYKPEEVKRPSDPVDIYVQEALDLHSRCQPDIGRFLPLGFTGEYIDSLVIRSDALKEAESDWTEARNNIAEASKAWKEQVKPAYELRDDILHKFRYAFRNSEDVMRKLKLIATGRSHADMIQDLNDLEVIGKAHSEPLINTTFDMTLLDKAKELSYSLGRLLADYRAADKSSEAKDLRDRAYTYLKEVVDEIRTAGQSLFWKTPDKVVGYRSDYRHKINLNSKKNKDDHIDD